MDLETQIAALREENERLKKSCVLQNWVFGIPMQQQTVLMAGIRGPDGIRKLHPMKAIVLAYRACVVKAAYFGRSLYFDEVADTFMTMDVISDNDKWGLAVRRFFDHIDELPHHYIMHLAHGAQIIGAHHCNLFLRGRWQRFYEACVDDAHMKPETSAEMNERLGDWGREHWGQ